jgi:hypothetical protein
MLLAVSFRSLSHRHNRFHRGIEELSISPLKLYVTVSVSRISTQAFVSSRNCYLPTFECWQPCTWEKNTTAKLQLAPSIKVLFNCVVRILHTMKLWFNLIHYYSGSWIFLLSHEITVPSLQMLLIKYSKHGQT